jgi:hypothetical protein
LLSFAFQRSAGFGRSQNPLHATIRRHCPRRNRSAPSSSRFHDVFELARFASASRFRVTTVRPAVPRHRLRRRSMSRSHRTIRGLPSSSSNTLFRDRARPRLSPGAPLGRGTPSTHLGSTARSRRPLHRRNMATMSRRRKRVRYQPFSRTNCPVNGAAAA